METLEKKIKHRERERRKKKKKHIKFIKDSWHIMSDISGGRQLKGVFSPTKYRKKRHFTNTLRGMII